MDKALVWLLKMFELPPDGVANIDELDPETPAPATDDDDRWGDVVLTDVLWEILRRLPQISGRRRLRLVCRRWRDVVDEVEPEVQRRRAKPLVFFKDGRYEPASAFLLHDVAGDCDVTSLSLFREEEEDDDGGDRDFFARYNNDDMVGSCNGLICLWFDRDPLYYGSIVVINPVTGESLHVPSLPTATRAGTISFGYHPTTGKYKIVHFPSNGGLVDDVTLGDSAAASSSSSSPSRHGRGGHGDGVVDVLTLGDDTAGGGGGARWR
ncbi:Os12g0493566 [Oryza sativa Japonica Group]|uniref:Os12g0493566 protein n=1 Tax=Oryza sativa subsp. japonica TaxID=39947 RepID=A0A0P0YA59_ORYSJ|nr:Os12g0493566 [Oryza sativa Japonica Group]